ncbi:MAG: YcxB family protein, partial [Clostridiales bacterium]|nr:YcxB family protein [Clostridiales bacterium]
LAGRTAIAVIAIIAVIIMIFALHKLTSQIDKTYKSYLEKFGGEAEIRLFFYEDVIVGKNLTAGSTVKAEYSQITNISETKNLYVLGLNGISILVDKNGFIGDNGAEFSKFIHEKCSKER